ncbi:TIGR00725 family protein [Capillimicrobium parvum]|uniref:TIGR00725 family protein n=1 Tax=Capillimicrobium parvum TaxID=2884022 RepID=A0A9E6XZU5_9ACTN|nr:TIGR00725 family protein [Capillimicrobium parvum]UGS37520.1 hypothetical protein DSM104329_03936 [Capillimicrobium parvum]
MAPYIAICGPGDDAAGPALLAAAHAAGRTLARAGAIVVTGGLGGAMAAACRGAAQEGGTTLGLLPGSDRRAANEWVTVAVATGMGELRNGLVVRSADAVIAILGGWGTLSEVALAAKLGRPVIGIGPWQLDGIELAPDGERAAARALELAGRG